MAEYVLHEHRVLDNDMRLWVLAIDHGDATIDRFIVYRNPYNAKDLYISHDQLYSRDLLKITRSFDGSNFLRILEKGTCDVIQREPLVLRFDGEFMNGTVVLPMQNQTYRVKGS